MKETRELICIGCPLGCPLTVTIQDGEVSVAGNTCPRGEAYGKKEVTNPTRTVTSTVKVTGGKLARVPVRTQGDIPKEKIFDCMQEIRTAKVNAPVQIGDVIIQDCAGTGVSVVACRNVNSK